MDFVVHDQECPVDKNVKVPLGAGVAVEADIQDLEAGHKRDTNGIIRALLGEEVKVIGQGVRGHLHRTEVAVEAEV